MKIYENWLGEKLTEEQIKNMLGSIESRLNVVSAALKDNDFYNLAQVVNNAKFDLSIVRNSLFPEGILKE